MYIAQICLCSIVPLLFLLLMSHCYCSQFLQSPATVPVYIICIINLNVQRFKGLEHVAEWLRHWTQYLGVWGSIAATPVMCKGLGQALNPHHLWPPSSNEYHVERILVLCEWLQLQKSLRFPHWDETVRASSNKSTHMQWRLSI